jgi:hypothetical protein
LEYIANAKVRQICTDGIAAKRAWLRGEITDEELAAARAAARAAAWAAARAAAWDAALYSRVNFICSSLKLAEKHRTHVKKRMEVWQKGYGLLCDIDGVLYCYKKI